VTAGERWREPSRRLKLRWGSYEGRYLGGLLWIIGGTVLLDGSNTYSTIFLLVGTVANVTGWLILPGPGLRRIWGAVLGLLAQWLLLTGPQSLWFMALPFLGWLLVRERPARSYPTLLIVVAGGILIAKSFTNLHYEALGYLLEALIVVGSAWLARAIATTKKTRARSGTVPENEFRPLPETGKGRN
jgi:hypothetical protein